MCYLRLLQLYKKFELCIDIKTKEIRERIINEEGVVI